MGDEDTDGEPAVFRLVGSLSRDRSCLLFTSRSASHKGDNRHARLRRLGSIEALIKRFEGSKRNNTGAAISK